MKLKLLSVIIVVCVFFNMSGSAIADTYTINLGNNSLTGSTHVGYDIYGFLGADAMSLTSDEVAKLANHCHAIFIYVMSHPNKYI